MRKIVLLSVSFLVILSLLYGTLTSHSQVSNDSHEYEYYYNENEYLDEGSDDMDWEDTPVGTDYPPAVTAQEIDKTPDSITVLVNREYPLPADYKPGDLVVPDVLFNFNYFSEKKLLRQEAADALEQLFEAAEKAGLSLCAISGYRSYERQEQIYTKNLRTKGAEHTNLFSATPGCSEHQSGLSMDVSTASVSNRLEEVFAGTPEGKWLAGNAHRYGFVIRYPKNKTRITGYAYEPWHIRYVGTELSELLYENGMCLEEYYNYRPSSDLLHDSGFGINTDVEAAPEKTAAPSGKRKDTSAGKRRPDSTKEPLPSETPTPDATPAPTATPEPSASPEPTPLPPDIPEETQEPAESPVPSAVPEPSSPGVPEETQNPIDNIESSTAPDYPAGSPDAPPEATEGIPSE